MRRHATRNRGYPRLDKCSQGNDIVLCKNGVIFDQRSDVI